MNYSVLSKIQNIDNRLAISNGLNNITTNIGNFFPATELKREFITNIWLIESKTRNSSNSTLSFTNEMQKIMLKTIKKKIQIDKICFYLAAQANGILY